MNPTIRDALPRDAASLPEVERSAGERFRTLPDLAWIADDDVVSAEAHAAYIEAGTVWVAEDATAGILGFLTAEAVEGELHVWELAVRFDAQGRGIGKRLLEAAIAHARGAGLRAVTLTTFRDVAWNGPFYARQGFATLDGAAIGERLSAVLRKEIENGLPGDRRCAMRLDLAEEPKPIREL